MMETLKLVALSNITFDLNSLLYIFAACVSIDAGSKVIVKFLRWAVNKLVKKPKGEEIDEEENKDVRVCTIENCECDAIRKLEESIELMHKDVVSIQNALDDYTKKSDKDIEEIKKTLKDDLREKITRIYNDCTAVGFIDQHTMFIVEQLYEDYGILKGNSFVDGLMINLRKLYASCTIDDGNN